jgi:hypothetical protein
MNIVRAPKGTDRKVIPLSEVQVPDLWHIYEALGDREDDIWGTDVWAKQLLECWHLAIDLLQNLRQLEAMGIQHSLDTGLLAPNQPRKAP